MFRKRIGDQSESKIDSDKYLLKKIKLDLPGHGEGLFGLYTLLNAVIDLDQFKLTIVCFRTFILVPRPGLSQTVPITLSNR